MSKIVYLRFFHRKASELILQSLTGEVNIAFIGLETKHICLGQKGLKVNYY